MEISDMFFDLKKAYRKRDFIAVTEENFESIKEKLGLKISLMDLQFVLDENKLEFKNLFHIERAVYPFCYREGLMFIDLSTDLDDVIKERNYRESIDKMNQMFNELISNSDFESLFCYIDPRYKFGVFMEILSKIPQDMMYDLFKGVYIQGYCGFDNLDSEQARVVLKSNMDRTSVEPLETDEAGYVTIFRGVGSKSTPLDKTFSWTISLNVAISFAKMYGSINGQVYKAKVKKGDIADFFQARNEEEVLTFPENVVDIEDLGLLNFNKQFKDELDTAGVIDKYLEMAQTIIPQLFNKPDGIHGVLHGKRVLLLTLIQSYFLKLAEEQKQILIWCSVFHDIGRKNDDEDRKHGIFSIQKMKDNDLVSNLTKRLGVEGVNIFKFIVENHAVSDSFGLRKINKYGIKDIKLAKKLYLLFKDADGLDRCRLGDFNEKFLRNDISKNLVLVAGQILLGIE